MTTDTTSDGHIEQGDDNDDFDVTGVAQYLAELSQEGPLPQGAGPRVDIAPFQPDDVGFESNDWLRKLLSIQAWLYLDRPVSIDAPAADAAIQVLEQISPDPAEACLTIDDLVSLTDLGVQHLETRLSRALAHREAFGEALEDGVSLGEASEDWIRLWQDVGGTLARHPAAIKATVKTFTIRNFADLAKDNDLELNPSYQRDNVWSTSDSQLLIDSILRGIPLPSIILTQVEGEDTRHQIVDGKQRLTAILRFIGQHPEARAYAKSFPDGEKEFDQSFKKFIRKRHLKGRDIAERYLPFRVRRYSQDDPLYALSGKYYSEIREISIPHGQGKVQVQHIFEKAASKYFIPLIVYENTRLQDIHHVFSIYNKQGKKLNAEELRNATFHHLGLTKLLLVLSGDRPNPSELAPYLPPDVVRDVGDVGDTLKERGFGTLRFKRTKVLSWVCALFLHRPGQIHGGAYSTPSTASHIDALLRSISEEKSSHPLFQNTTLVSLARDVKTAVLLHAELEDAWAPRFRSRKGHASRWEELPLVASMITTLVLVATGRQELLRNGIALVRSLTDERPGPSKTQNKTQWEFVAHIVRDILVALEVDLNEAGHALRDRYGHNCLAVFSALAGEATA